MIRTTSIAICAAAGFAASAAAQDTFPNFSAEFSIELQNDWTFDSTDSAAELNDTYPTIGAGLALAFTEQTSLNASLTFEPVKDPVDDRFFDDLGLYAEELFLRHDVGNAAITLGKFNPAFGVAWDAAPGIYGTDFAEDYQITERLGAALALPFDAFEGEHELAFAVFFADTTFLSESLFENRGRTKESDGGVSNTNSPESFALSVAGNLGATTYNLGGQFQSRGAADDKDQSGFVFGLGREVPIGGSSVELLAEAAIFPNFDGTDDAALYGTFGAAVPIGPVTLSGVYGLRDIEDAITDHLATATAEIEIYNGVTLGVGYRFGHEDDENGHTLGALLVYEFGI